MLKFGENEPDIGLCHDGRLRPGGHPPHAQTARPEVKLLKHPLNWWFKCECARYRTLASGFRSWKADNSQYASPQVALLDKIEAVGNL